MPGMRNGPKTLCRPGLIEQGLRSCLESRAMLRRWVAIVLLSVVSLQSVWAAAAAYCGHEASAEAAQHPGHHLHDHEHAQAAADASPQAPAADGPIPGDHLDCHACHGCPVGLATGASTSLADPDRGYARPHSDRRPPLPPTAAPDRPDWRRLA